MESKPVTLKGVLSAYKIPLAIAALIVLLLIVLYTIDKNQDSSSSKAGTTASTNQTTIVIRELGVQMTLPPVLKGMKYSPVTIRSTSAKNVPLMVNLELSQYSSLANSCLGGNANGAHPFATLVQINGKAGDDANSPHSTETLKQFDTFYIKQLGPSIPDATKCQDVATRQALSKLSTKLDSALKTAFSTAQKLN